MNMVISEAIPSPPLHNNRIQYYLNTQVRRTFEERCTFPHNHKELYR